ncbi:hypothetical protein ASC61_01940 [Aeromicrobium sp. Root344]|uniref:hypothetical protein n=1 Tax=Aeromicrobium sp. Root344 TaxID=1736521 RepID=UPI000700BA8A|nr:hypothetical protein [Aeromicrobium sp. Root344]KQV73867.1 hypothetical protein ASC61_01940 [Aeromicrobium sp. Root344]
MRFVIDGRTFDLEAEDIRARLRGHTPGNIQTHWVEVEGARWPVKQALAIALQPDRPRFQSQTARRHLRKLGFTVSPDGQRGSVDSGSHGGAFDESSLPIFETVDASVTFSWRRAGKVTLDTAGIPKFPALPRVPGLYRFDFEPLGDDSQPSIYIGESVNLRSRGSNYRNAKTDRSRQRTSRRIHKELVAHLSQGGAITFSISSSASLGVGGESIDLRWTSARRMAENAAVLLAQMEGTANVLNIDADLTDSSDDDTE